MHERPRSGGWAAPSPDSSGVWVRPLEWSTGRRAGAPRSVQLVAKTWEPGGMAKGGGSLGGGKRTRAELPEVPNSEELSPLAQGAQRLLRSPQN